MPVRYPFGYGLSYTTFDYHDMKLSADKIKDTDKVTVSVQITNTGKVAGKEIVQLYVADKTGAAARPSKELKGFAKVALEPGETRTVEIELDQRSFAWFNTEIHDWYAASGEYEILIGASSRDIRLKSTLQLTSTRTLPMEITRNTVVEELMGNPATAAILGKYVEQFTSMMGGDKEKNSDAANEAVTEEMTMKMMENSPLRSFRSFMGISNRQLDELIRELQEAIA